MKKEININADSIVELIKKNKSARIVIYSVGAIVGIYILGKTFTILASSLRGFNDFKSAWKGE